ncbi:MAG TPA: hypothetical protein VHC96_00090 [Puia sp.]|jgi:hypothetical protein|nr:hypothetical protein [Puia sp.]
MKIPGTARSGSSDRTDISDMRELGYFPVKTNSRTLLYLTLLGAALLGNVFVFGQSRMPGGTQLPGKLEFGQTLPGYIKPPMVMKITGGRVQNVWAQGAGVDSVQILSPDRMPCVVTDLSRVESMPVQRSRNREPMPNMMARKPIVRVIAFPGGQK